MPTPEDVPMEDHDNVKTAEGSLNGTATLSRDELRNLIREVEVADMVENATWYLIAHRWWNSLLKAIRDGFVDDVGPIDNSQISECRQGSFYLKQRLAEQVDYTAVPEHLFRRLSNFYGVEDERRDFIRRTVVKKNGQLSVEVYPRIVHIALARNRDIKADLVLKPEDTMISLRERAIMELSLNESDKIQFYVMNDENPELIDTSQSIDSYFDTVQKVLVDVEEQGEFFFRAKNPAQQQAKSSFANQSSSSLGSNGNGLSNSYNSHSSSTGIANRTTPGACGLSNLGNTCFMASAFQCLSNMPPLRDYFLNDAYLADINEENPLGTHGHLAAAVGDLMKGIWSDEYASINPRKFKAIIGQFAPRFNGYSQQDAHELMAYVLDGLHEDLNRIKNKPYVEDSDEDAKLPEAEYAAKSWEIYKMRNDSIIVDTLHGQLKSTLICPVCEKISIKFDPFGYLSLPLPAKEQIVKQTVIVMFLTRKWAKFSLGITDTTNVEEAEKLMLDKLQPEKNHHFVFFHVPSQYTDDVTIMRPSDKVRIPGREVYVAEVEHDLHVRGTRIFVAYNRIKLVRPVSLPMVYSLEPGQSLTREYLNRTVFATTKKFFVNQKNAMELSASNDDDSMNGGNSNDDREPYKLFVANAGSATSLPVTPTNEPIPFPDENSHDIYRNFLQITFQFKDSKIFNNYKGSELIEREMTVSTRRKVMLEETLEWFTKKEQLGEQDSWYCPQCKKHERATKQLDLWKLPEILILHLKRFQYTKWSREKLTWDVVIPVRGLDLTEKVANPNHEKAIYDLIAVSRHYGSLSGGHYTAIGFNDKAQKWFDFNDSSASSTSSPTEPYESSDPYILVYRRRKLDANGEPIEPFEETDFAQNIRPKRGAAPSMSSATTSAASSSRHQVDENMEMEED